MTDTTKNQDQAKAHQLAYLLEADPSEWGGLKVGWAAANHLRRLADQNARLLAMLDAIGAGGVEPLRRPANNPQDATKQHKATPPQPMEDSEIKRLWQQFAPVIGGPLEFARAIERHHGIGGEA